MALAQHFQRDVPWAYNRKEAKRHGEGGILVGAPLQGRVLVVDDVITAGTAVREVLPLIERHGARCVGVAVGLDRQERGSSHARSASRAKDECSAIQEIEREFDLSVISIIGLHDLIDYLRQTGRQSTRVLDAMQAYREQYGVV